MAVMATSDTPKRIALLDAHGWGGVLADVAGETAGWRARRRHTGEGGGKREANSCEDLVGVGDPAICGE